MESFFLGKYGHHSSVNVFKTRSTELHDHSICNFCQPIVCFKLACIVKSGMSCSITIILTIFVIITITIILILIMMIIIIIIVIMMIIIISEDMKV